MRNKKRSSKPSPAKMNGNKRPLVTWLLGAITASIIPYVYSLRGGFVRDDLQLIIMDPASQNISFFAKAFQKPFLYGFSKSEALYYRPLVTISYQLNNTLSLHNSVLCRLTNVMLYAAATALVVLFLWKLTSKAAVAGVGGIAFAVLPSHTESVAWVAGRTDIIAGIFMLGSFLAFIEACRARPRFHWPLAGICSLLFGCALLSKEHALVLPLLLGIYAWVFLDSIRRDEVLKWTAVLMLPMVIYVVMRRYALEAPFDSQITHLFKERILRTGFLCTQYVRMLFIPQLLRPVYDDPSTCTLSTPALLAAWLTPIALVATSIWARRKAPIVAFGAAWVLVGLLPVVDIIPLRGGMVAERFVYISSIGSSMIIGWVICKIYECRPKSFQIMPIAAAILASGYLIYSGACAMSSSLYSESNLEWARRVAQTKPRHAFSLFAAGEFFAATGYYKEAAQQFEAAFDLNLSGVQTSQLAQWKNLLGIIYTRGGNTSSADRAFVDAVRLDPNYAQAWRNLGRARFKLGKFDAAVRAYEHAFQLASPSARDLFDSAAAYECAGMTGKARRMYELVVKRYPNSKYAQKASDGLY
ncbi:MAG: tetratricopeptide repeat protein [Armatimonadota bacterium]|nr:tetratricopeptide repeat protein [bacterium]